VLSNSLATTVEMWNPLLPLLSGRLRVVRYDARGHGRSPVPDGPYSIADLGGDVLALLDRLGIERASFCGISLGGMVAQWLGAHAPERLDRLVICCSASKVPSEPFIERAAEARAPGGPARLAPAVVERWLTPAFAREHPEVRQFLFEMLIATPGEGSAACCEAIAAMDLRPVLGAITAPTLVVAASEDPATPPAHGALIARNVTGARLTVIRGAAHLANLQAPGPVTAALLGHLRSITREGRPGPPGRRAAPG
jgi:3-oxoadipate enol-lactonase